MSLSDTMEKNRVAPLLINFEGKEIVNISTEH